MTIADFLKAPLPAPADLPDLDPAGPDRFFNRELSWLGFNWRVLEEAENPNVPLLERLRFLSISATNLDEFYNVRVAGLRELAKAGNTTPAVDGLTPAEQLVLINEDARKLLESQQATFRTLRAEMERECTVEMPNPEYMPHLSLMYGLEGAGPEVMGKKARIARALEAADGGELVAAAGFRADSVQLWLTPPDPSTQSWELIEEYPLGPP